MKANSNPADLEQALKQGFESLLAQTMKDECKTNANTAGASTAPDVDETKVHAEIVQEVQAKRTKRVEAKKGQRWKDAMPMMARTLKVVEVGQVFVTFVNENSSASRRYVAIQRRRLIPSQGYLTVAQWNKQFGKV